MSRQKRTTLPPVTEADITAHPELLRRTPKSWAWKCQHCGEFASSETLAGKYVCRRHGGTTPRQRDLVVRSQAVTEGKPVPRPPGRPLLSGLYSKREHVRIDQVVLDYQARKIDPDATDENMLYLRAYLQVMQETRPEAGLLREPLQELVEQAESFLSDSDTGDGEVTVDELMDLLELGTGFGEAIRPTTRLLKTLKRTTRETEFRHARLIGLSKVRAETRVRNIGAEQVQFVSGLARWMMAFVYDLMTPDDFLALQKRMERDLSEVPLAVLDHSASIRTA